ncbi:MAG: PAS domain-containing protein [Rubrivivax sp.]|nr:MAG: PAS domain-containing protein [Rubrivivax sp.]
MVNPSTHPFLTGNGPLARLLREHDWSQSPLGEPGQWPQSLRSVVHLVLGSAFPMFVAWGPNLRAIYNDAYAEIMGAKHPAGIGQPFLDIWSEINDELIPLAKRVMAGEALYIENLPLRMRRHGYEEDTWFTFSWSPVLDDTGHIAGIHCACVETTRMVLAENRVRAREQWLEALFDQAPGFAAVVRGRDHVFEMANQAYFKITGERELIGKPFAQALPEVVEQGFMNWLDDAFRSGVPHVGRSVPVTVNQGAGTQPYDAYIDFMYQPLRDARGEVEGIFIQGHEVTEQHRAEQALRDADRQKDEFLATLAHELRNPLAPIRTTAHLLSSTADPTVHAKAAAIIQRQTKHMARLLDDLIDISRITQGRVLLKKEQVSVGSVVEAAMEAARPLA